MERQQETERNTGRDYKSERYRVTRERRAQRKKYFKNGALGTMYIYIYIHSHMKYQMFFFFFQLYDFKVYHTCLPSVIFHSRIRLRLIQHIFCTKNIAYLSFIWSNCRIESKNQIELSY